MELWPPDRVSRSDYAVVGLAAIPLGRADKAHSLHPRGRGRPVDAGKNHRAGAKTPFFPPITPYLCQHSVLAAPRLNCWRLQSYPAVPRADCVRQQSSLAAPILLHGRQCTCPAAPTMLHGRQCIYLAVPRMLHCRPSSSLGVPTIYGGNPARVM